MKHLFSQIGADQARINVKAFKSLGIQLAASLVAWLLHRGTAKHPRIAVGGMTLTDGTQAAVVVEITNNAMDADATYCILKSFGELVRYDQVIRDGDVAQESGRYVTTDSHMARLKKVGFKGLTQKKFTFEFDLAATFKGRSAIGTLARDLVDNGGLFGYVLSDGVALDSVTQPHVVTPGTKSKPGEAFGRQLRKRATEGRKVDTGKVNANVADAVTNIVRFAKADKVQVAQDRVTALSPAQWAEFDTWYGVHVVSRAVKAQ